MSKKSHIHPTPKVDADPDILKQMAEGSDVYAEILQPSAVSAPARYAPVCRKIERQRQVVGSAVLETVLDEGMLERSFDGAPDYIKPDLRELLLECGDRVEFHRLYRDLKEKDASNKTFRFLPGLLIWLFHIQKVQRILKIPAPDMGRIDQEGWRISGSSMALLKMEPVPQLVVSKNGRKQEIDLVYFFQGLMV